MYLMNAIGFALRSVIAAASMMAVTGAANAQDSPDAVKLLIRWHDTKPADALLNTGIFVSFHNGQFDAFDLGEPLPALMADWIGAHFLPLPDFFQAFTAMYPDTLVEAIWNPRPNAPGRPIGDPPFQKVVTLDPGKHRFMSYFFPIYPSNDALVANEDPYEIEVFDSQGKFKGPLYVEVFGNQVIDAGMCENSEVRLNMLDTGLASNQECSGGEGGVLPHPGLNGSFRNPDATPQRVLGGRTSFLPPTSPSSNNYDAINADFSRPGYKLGRLLITRWAASGNWSGSWYSPERAGEGFNVELVEPAPGQPRTRVLVYWYTFKPDGSGEQVWLAGMGEMDTDSGVAANVEMYVTTGGEFASTQNPGRVDRERWGTIRIGFGNCDSGGVYYQPDDPDWPAGGYLISRLSPQIEGLAWVCAHPFDARLILPED